MCGEYFAFQLRFFGGRHTHICMYIWTHKDYNNSVNLTGSGGGRRFTSGPLHILNVDGLLVRLRYL